MEKIMNKICIIIILALAGVLFLTGCSSDGGGGGNGPVDKTALVNKIAEAKAELNIPSVSTDGTDKPLGTSWVPSAAKTTFQAAITSAEGVRDSSSASQEQVNNEHSKLNHALNVFKNAQRPGTDDPLDKTAFNAMIAEAELYQLMVLVSDNAANVSVGVYWVTQTAMNTFTSAIATAKTALNDVTTKSALASAQDALQSAMSAFIAAGQEGSKNSGFSAEEMTALITQANTAKTGVETSTANGDDVSPAKYWVSPSELTALENAITTAQAATGNIDSAYLSLVDAINTFDECRQQGTSPDKNALFDAIRSADQVKTGDIAVATSASSAPYGLPWATPTQWASFNTALSNALTVASNYNATKNMVSAALNNLNSAIDAFNQAVTNNGEGTRQNSITINGFSSSTYPNGSYIFARIIVDDTNISSDEANSYGDIQNGSATIQLTSSSSGSPWGKNGSWFVLLQVNPDGFSRYYISKSAVDFTSTPHAVKKFSDFKKYAFSIKLGEVARWIFTSPGQTMTLDDWYFEVFGNSYANIFYRDEALTQTFSGSAIVNADTVIYSESPIYIDGGDRGEKIGEITGMITLTNIPNPPPRVIMSASGLDGNNWSSHNSTINMSGITGSSATVNWSIPIYENNNFVSGQATFRLWFMPRGGNDGFDVQIPGSKNVDSPTANVGSLGTVNIGTITLRGTVNVSYGGSPVSSARIVVSTEQNNDDRWVRLDSPGNNAPWSITMRALDNPTNIIIIIDGFSNDGEWFQKDVTPNPPISVSNQNISGISLNAAIQTITLSGTINATYDGNTVSQVEIDIKKDSGILATTTIESPGNNAPWSIRMQAPSTPMEIYFTISGYSNDGEWFQRNITPNPPITISTQNRSGISLNVAIKTITLSGTINFTSDGDPVSFIEISVRAEDGNPLGNITLYSPVANNAPWSITMQGPGTPTEIFLIINGHTSNEAYFNRHYTPNPPIIVSNESIPNITIELGDILDGGGGR
jgi:hypothetical protein